MNIDEDIYINITKDEGENNMTVFAIPIKEDKLIEGKVLCDFIAQGKKKSLERKKEMNERMKKISAFIEIKES